MSRGTPTADEFFDRYPGGICSQHRIELPGCTHEVVSIAVPGGPYAPHSSLIVIGETADHVYSGHYVVDAANEPVSILGAWSASGPKDFATSDRCTACVPIRRIVALSLGRALDDCSEREYSVAETEFDQRDHGEYHTTRSALAGAFWRANERRRAARAIQCAWRAWRCERALAEMKLRWS